jgi:hypothetical protein
VKAGPQTRPCLPSPCQRRRRALLARWSVGCISRGWDALCPSAGHILGGA